MSALLDRDGVLRADPDTVAGQSHELSQVADNIDTAARLLSQVETAGAWESPAGDTFAGEVGEVPEQLRAVALRLRAAAELLGPYAGRLRDAQEELRRVERSYQRAQARIADCDRILATAEPGSPEQARAEADRGAAVATSNRMMDRHEEVGRDILADESRVAAELLELSEHLADPRGYDVWEGVRDAGRGPLFTSPVASVAKPLRLGTALDPIGQTGLKLGYDEGSWGEIGRSSASLTVDAVIAGAGKYARRGLTDSAPAAPPRAKGATVPGLPSNPQRVRSNAITRRWGDEIDSGRAWATTKSRETVVKRVKDETGWSTFDGIARDWAALGGATRRTKAAVAVKSTAATYKYGKKTITTSEQRGEQIRGAVDPEAAELEERLAAREEDEARSLGYRAVELPDGTRPDGDGALRGRGPHPAR